MGQERGRLSKWRIGMGSAAIVGVAWVCTWAYSQMRRNADRDWEKTGQETRLRMVQEQLAGVKALLRDYKARHGRYPTGDEGLAALDNFAVRFPVPAYRIWSSQAHGSKEPPSAQWYWFWWNERLPAKRELNEYRRIHGSFPASLAEARANEFEFQLVPMPDDEWPWQTVDLAVDASGEAYAMTPAGPLSVWILPLLYENRNGLDAKAFNGSPANADPGSRYSVEVDTGIYVSCVGGESLAAALDARPPRRFHWDLAGLAAAIGAIMSLAVWLLFLQRTGCLGKVLAIVLLLVSAGLLLPALGTTLRECWWAHKVDRDPRTLQRQRDLLEQYLQAGVISDQTFTKAKAFLDDSPASAPASRATSKLAP